MPEAPTIIPPLPYDFFYPFTSAYQQGGVDEEERIGKGLE